MDTIKTFCESKNFFGLSKSLDSKKVTSKRARNRLLRIKDELGFEPGAWSEFLEYCFKTDMDELEVHNEVYFQYLLLNTEVRFAERKDNDVIEIANIDLSKLVDASFSGNATSIVKSILYTFIRNGKVRFFSPYSEELCNAITNLDEDSFLFRDSNGNEFIVSFFGPANFANYDLQIYLLSENVVYFYSDRSLFQEPAFRTDLIFSRLSKVLKRHRKLKALSSGKGLTVTNKVFPHIGHHLWNNMSVWGVLVKQGLLNRKCLYEVRAGVYGNPLESALRDRDNLEFIEYVNHDNFDFDSSLYISISEDFITKDLASSLVKNCVKVSKDSLSKEYEIIAGKLNEDKSQLVCISLRFGNREWEEQEEGLIHLMDKLISNFSNLKFLIDGMNRSEFSNSSSHANLEVKKELGFVHKAKMKFGENKVVSLINEDLRLVISILDKCQVFITPWGAGLAKYKWLLNKKSIIYTSDHIFNTSPDLRIYSSPIYREDIVDDVFIVGTSVDSKSTLTQRGFRGNFSLSWYELFLACEKELLNLKD